MVKYTVEDLRRVMDCKHNIRNISIVGHSAHGKSTLTDSLIAAAGIISQEVAGNVRMTDTRKDEAEHGYSIKSTGISLLYDINHAFLKEFPRERSGNEFLINLIDAPGRMDFLGEVTASLRLTDGAIAVVDCVEGVCVQTKTVLREALREMVRPVMTLSKLDRFFLELQVDGEDAYQRFRKIIETVNATMAAYADEQLGDVTVYPEEGTVAFSSGLHGWAFTLANFARMYASKFGVDERKMIERLWGENYFDSATKEWTSKSTGSATCKRGFVQFCYEPIRHVISICMNDQKEKKEKLWPMLKRLGVAMNKDEQELTGKSLMKRVMQKWFPASCSLLEMMIFHLPSPATAQTYRRSILYPDNVYDRNAAAIIDCDADGPLMLYVSKMVPEKGRFFAIGRVFAGKVCSGTKVRIMGPTYKNDGTQDLYFTDVRKLAIWMGNKLEDVADVPCGNIVAIGGVDQYITKTATLAEKDNRAAHCIRGMKFSVSPVVRVAVRPKLAKDLRKLVEGVKRLAKSDPLIVCTIEDTGEHVISGAGELHLQISVKDLQDDFMGGTEIIQSKPSVSFRETVIGRSSPHDMSKSPNKKNRLYMEARPLEDGIAEAIDDGRIGPDKDKDCAQILPEEFGWDRDLPRNIWCFGPENTGPNMVVNVCRGKPYLNDIKNSVVAGFQSASKEGVLTKERMRGICFELSDVFLHRDANQRGGDQIIETAIRAVHASQLTAKPRLLEPVYLVEIQAPEEALCGIHSVLTQKRGYVFEQMQMPGTPLFNIKGYLPVVESFGFSSQLRAQTSGEAFPLCVQDHWELVSSDPFEAGSRAANLVSEIRRRKGLKEHVTRLFELEG